MKRPKQNLTTVVADFLVFGSATAMAVAAAISVASGTHGNCWRSTVYVVLLQLVFTLADDVLERWQQQTKNQ